MMFPKPSKLSLPALDRKLWKIVSECVRRRDAASNGICTCVTCGRIDHWIHMQAGHFISRSKKSTKFNPMNISAQCVKCNFWGAGKQFEHGIALDKKWGNGTAENLLMLSKLPCKRSKSDYLILIDQWSEKLKALKRTA